MRLFYDPNIDSSNQLHTLSEDESKHIVRVLRMSQGDQLILLDGKGGSYTCEITDAHHKKCVVKIVDQHQAAPDDYDIHIAVSPTKQSERMEWFVEKATEIGITEISFIRCKNSERVKLKVERLEKKAISAMKQSHRKFLPKLNDLSDFNTFIQENPNGAIAHCYEGDKHTLTEVFTDKSCPILIGPEGDFTEEEVELAVQHGYKLITLGENRLRTETAALYACMQARLLTE